MKLRLPGTRSNLYYSAISANLASMAVGTHYSWSSPTIPKLQKPDSWLPISHEQASWIGSLTALGTVFGPFIGSWLVNFFGRRQTLMVSVLVNLIAWLILLTANSVWQLYIGRFTGGLGGGITFMACPMYVAEIAPSDIRGALGSLFAFFLTGGYLIQYACGPYVSYTSLIIINVIPSITFFLFFAIAPESPYFLLRKNEFSQAQESLIWLRPCDSEQDIQLELKEIQTEVQTSLNEKATFFDLVRTRGNRMGLLLSCGTIAGQQCSGANVVFFYAQNIFILAGSTFSTSISAIIIGAISFGAGGLAPALAKAFGIKNMLIVSAAGMGLFQVGLGLYFYFSKKGIDMTSLNWLPILILVGYILCYTIGFGPLPWAVMAEVFPSNMKAIASAITASFCWFVGFLLTKFFSNVTEILGAHVAFFIFAFGCVFALLFTIFVLPDTRGMSLQQILDLLNKKTEDNLNSTKEREK